MENNNCQGETPMFNLFIIPSKNGQDLTPEEIQKAISENKYGVIPLNAKIKFIGLNVEIKSPSNKSK